MIPLARRSLLRIAGAGSAGLAGCVGSDPRGLPGDEAEAEGPSGDGANDGIDGTVVDYEALSDRGKAFVDEVLGNDQNWHTLRWIGRDGERVYYEYDEDDDHVVPIEDPLTMDSVDDALDSVFRGDAHLERGGERYEGVATVGTGHYRFEYTLAETEGCEEVTDRNDLTDRQQALVDILVEHGDAWVSDPRFRPIADADLYDTGDEMTVLERACLQREDRFMRVERRYTESAMVDGYRLEPVEDE